MDRAAFDAVATRLTREAERSPGHYRLRVFLLALLGYGVLLLLLVTALLLSAGVLLAILATKAFLLLRFAWLPLIFAFVLFKSLWARIPPPAGRRLTRREAPALHREIDEVARRLRAPRAHEVLLVDDFNAAVTQVPRLGVLGWPKNYLLLGLPLLLTISPEQLRAVLGHEFGHLSRRHSRFAAGIYRTRRSWDRALEGLARGRHHGSGLLARFLAWYAPYFSAYSFALARADEYEADRCSARLVGAAAAAQTLVDVRVRAEAIGERFWRRFYRLADEHAAPPRNPYEDLRKLARVLVTDEEAREIVQRALQQRADSTDTHPSLAERLQAPPAPTTAYRPTGRSAAEALLQPALPALLREFETRWRAGVEHSWRERHAYVQSARARLAAYATRAIDALADDKLWDYANVAEEFQGAEAALPLYRALVARAPAHAGAQFALGRLLLARAGDDGIAHIERAMSLAEDAVKPGCELLYGYFMQNRRAADAERYATRWREADARLQQARAERASVHVKDDFLPHALPDATLAQLTAQLKQLGRVQRALLVRKKLAHFPESPLFVLAVIPRGFTLSLNTVLEKLTRELRFPGELLVYVCGSDRKLWRKLRKVAGARIYRHRWFGIL